MTDHHQNTHTYSLIKPTGNGAFGMVYQAKDTETGRIVAIKKVFQDNRYKNRELSILKELNHPNCCYLYDYFYTNASDNPDEQYLNLIMDYMPENLYKELKSYSRNGRHMPLLLIQLYSYQIIRSLAYIHALGICHRDIKPQNILTNPETHELQMCDFGSAKSYKRGNLTYHISLRDPTEPLNLFSGLLNIPVQLIYGPVDVVLRSLFCRHPFLRGRAPLIKLWKLLRFWGHLIDNKFKR